jgi:glycosyltransferase involved in cell wall biosynthesis
MGSFSVVILCYNYGRFLDDAVASVLSQAGVDLRVLIIDDASTDDSSEVAKRYAADDPRVELTVHAVNRGTIASANEGLEWADGDYTVVVDADDLLTPGALRRAMDLLDAHPGVGFVYGNALRFTHGTPLPTVRTRVTGWSVWPGQLWLERRFRQAQNCLVGPETVVRTSVQKRVGGYDPRMPHTSDFELWLRLAANADVGYIRGADQLYYRRHGQNLSMAWPPLPTLHQYRLAFEAALDDYGDKLPGAPRLSDLVHRRLARDALVLAARAYDKGRTEETPIDEFVAFAFDCWPEAKKLPIYQTLQLRKRIGPRAMPYLQPFILPSAGRKAQSWWWRQSWRRRGF